MTFNRVEACGLTKVYGRQRALAGVDLTLRAGEVAVLLGPNGAGKSTLIGILATLIRPSTGQVLCDDQAVSSDLRSAIGLIAHESLCYGDLTGRENVEFFARLYAVANPVRRAAVLIERVGLVAAADRPTRTYSRGMLQRLAVARALVHRPQLLLADEPFTGLDQGGVAALSTLLAEERTRGVVMLIASHDFEAVAPICDRVLVLNKGKLAHDGPAPSDRSSSALGGVYRTASQEAS